MQETIIRKKFKPPNLPRNPKVCYRSTIRLLHNHCFYKSTKNKESKQQKEREFLTLVANGEGKKRTEKFRHI
jgi:hypothetical protein